MWPVGVVMKANLAKGTIELTDRKTLLDLKENDCRWPIGDLRNPDFHFCGAQRLAGRPYCPVHWRMAFAPGRALH
jgi:GcrA cell cycle regulator